MWALRLGSRTSRPSWQSVWIAARTVGRATPNSAASSSSGRRHAGLDLAVEDPRAQRDDDGFLRRDRPHGQSAHQAAKIVGRRISAPASSRGRDSAHAQRARLVAPPRRRAHVEHALGRHAQRIRVEVAEHGLERRAELLQRAGLSPRETATNRLPERAASATSSRAPALRRAPARSTRASDSSPLSSSPYAALAGQPLEPAGQPVTVRQRLDAPAQGGAAIERALAVAASLLVHDRLDRAAQSTSVPRQANAMTSMSSSIGASLSCQTIRHKRIEFVYAHTESADEHEPCTGLWSPKVEACPPRSRAASRSQTKSGADGPRTGRAGPGRRSGRRARPTSACAGGCSRRATGCAIRPARWW